jgi:aminoglycoside/choline kinase family phosphotransferase
VLGIFSRLCYRDNKPNYLQDLPRIMQYLLSVCEKYPELKSFKEFLAHLPLQDNLVSSQ